MPFFIGYFFRMNAYQKEQLDALQMVRRHLKALPDSETAYLKAQIADYQDFRSRVAGFLESHFAGICNEKCYQSRLSACCSRDGIVAFFADVLINAMSAEEDSLDTLENAIQQPEKEFKCIFLSATGCLWQVKPIVCEMFLCDAAEDSVFVGDSGAVKQWERFKAEEKTFTWPDRPVVFEALEAYFMIRGCDSPLMYMHKSPGLVRIRSKRGL